MADRRRARGLGLVTAVRGQLLLGVALVVLGLLVGPGGVSVFT